MSNGEPRPFPSELNLSDEETKELEEYLEGACAARGIDRTIGFNHAVTMLEAAIAGGRRPGCRLLAHKGNELLDPILGGG